MDPVTIAALLSGGSSLLGGLFERSKKLKFKTPPLTPQQQYWWQQYRGQMENPAFKGLGGDITQTALGHLARLNPSWQSPQMIRGQGGVGYQGSPGIDPQAFQSILQRLQAGAQRPQIPQGGGGPFERRPLNRLV